MNDAQRSVDVPEQPANDQHGVEQVIATLRLQGAQVFDPVRLHYVTALAERLGQQSGNARRMLQEKFAVAASTLKTRLEHARNEATTAVAAIADAQPHALPALRNMLAAGDFRGVRRRLQALQHTQNQETLGELVRSYAQHAPADTDGAPHANLGYRSDLRAVRQSRNTWSKLSADKQLSRALEQAPTHAGPINSHMLVLRSVALMRDISPDYLNRFMAYVDTLLVLEQGEKAKLANAVQRSASAARGKPKIRRGPAR